MSTLKVNTVESASTPTVLISDGLSVSGVSTLTGGLKVGSAVTISDNGNFGITGIMTASSYSGITTTALPAGTILQVKSVTKTDTASNYSSSNTSWRIGGTTGSSFGVAITPRSATSKMLITGTLSCSVTGPQYNIGVHVMKYTGSGSAEDISGATADAASNRKRVHSVTEMNHSDNTQQTAPFNYLDTAGQTTEIIYSLGLNNPSSTSRTVYINRGVTDTDQIYYPRAVSTITVMEIAG